MTPKSFTHIAELKNEWKFIVGKCPIHVKHLLTDMDTKRISLISKQFKYPVIALEHKDYLLFNKDIVLIENILKVINTVVVHEFSGLKFIKPLSSKDAEFINTVIDTFDAEITNIEEN